MKRTSFVSWLYFLAVFLYFLYLSRCVAAPVPARGPDLPDPVRYVTGEVKPETEKDSSIQSPEDGTVSWFDVPDYPNQRFILASAPTCEDPSPNQAVVSRSIEVPYELVKDGGFESGAASPKVSLLSGRRTSDRSHRGSFCYELSSRISSPGTVTFLVYPDGKKRSLSVTMYVYLEGKADEIGPVATSSSGSSTSVTTEWLGQSLEDSGWRRLEFLVELHENVPALYVGLVFSGLQGKVYLDDVSVTTPVWDYAEYWPGAATIELADGMDVHAAVRRLLFRMSIHIEDVDALRKDEKYFRQKSYVIERLAELFHSAGGFLNVQPEMAWMEGAERFDPDLLRRLSSLYGVTYSTHTHGPRCMDAESCEAQTVEYIFERKKKLEELSGTVVVDHNGNFDLDIMDDLAAGDGETSGFRTLSGFKNKYTQLGYDYLKVNPWRPETMAGWTDEARFLIHSSASPLIYIPNTKQGISRYHPRAKETLKRVLSQFIKFSSDSSSDVNVLNLIIHVDSFQSFEGLAFDDYLSYDRNAEEVIPSGEFEAHLRDWEGLLTQVIEPLESAGYLDWATAQDIADAFEEWEQTNCPDSWGSSSHRHDTALDGR